MPVSDCLKEYMSKHGYTKADISRMSNIPYTTIDGLFKKGDENTKLSTLKKLASLIGCTIDDMAFYNEDNNSQSQSQFTHQEEKLIKKYRQLNADGKNRVDYVLNMEFDLMNNSAEKEEQRLG